MNRDRIVTLAAIFGTDLFYTANAQEESQILEISPEDLSYLSYAGFNYSCNACLSGPERSIHWGTAQDCSLEFENRLKVTYAENMGLCLKEEYDPGFECDTNYKTNIFDCEI